MQHIFADRTISISEFKQNPGKAIDAAEGKPLAVLKNNKPGFYAVPAELFEQIADIIDDLLLADTVRERMERGKFVKVDLEDL
jgi:antitoxin StbD